MEVMVAGSNGFLAKNLISKLSENPEYTRIYAVNRRSGWSVEDLKTKSGPVVDVYSDLRNAASCSTLFKTLKPEIIFHIAAQQGRTPEAYEANVLMTSNLLKYCPEGCKFVYASSSTVYGDLAQDLYGSVCDAPQKCWESNETIPTSLYGASKLAGEGLVHAYTSAGKISPLILRYVAMVGKDATHGVLPDIIRKMNRDGDLELFGEEPGSEKPYMHVDDIVSSTLHLTENGYEGIYNVSPADELTIQQIASYVRYHLGMDGKKKFIWLGESVVPPGDNRWVKLDNSKLLETGWEPVYKTSMEAIKQATKEILEAQND